MIRNFDGSVWNQNGPLVITRVLEKLCGLRNSQLASPCHGFKLLAQEDCYSIRWYEWKMFMRERDADEVKRRTSGSHFIHLWNRNSNNYRLRVDSKTAFMELAARHCPRVHHSRDEFF